ncbi:MULTISPECIES: ribonuclease R family protein [Cyanophyceae]|uniref:ribonuclease catalytic domain-containing protein n=1 Tax=Cyanophyceae TaxID=3028117 RepID=UPI001681E2F3|nr:MULTISPECIES: ribonuclease R family protein [Cyanophyceae]MBD1915525.1 VacB/RNase II family 3'-5' exoribonuclease [Phormidium sp. FACHB-77]MBD2031835.1 VacB/RNase II family 3'-5' exoribonuclease [Phormidium sp. FACHB-322]MBD2050585.1 VacB/RNase II family 3'-5' exoribonuclease [Leptolyngbya sp. FACHB-60]
MVDKGTLVEFKHQGQPRLGVVDRPEGKKNWVVIDERGQAYTLHPRDLTYEVSGNTYNPADIAPFAAEAGSYIDPSSLEIAWEFFAEAGEFADPAALAELLFSDQSPTFCYAAHRLLVEDKIFFKQKGDRYEPRPAAQVDELQRQLERETQRQQEWESFITKARQAMAGEPVEWEKSDRPRLEILERLALLGDESSQRTQAVEILSALGVNPTAAGAFDSLVALGLWSVHENLALRRSQIPGHFSEETLTMAQQRLQSPPPDPDTHRVDLTHLKAYTVDDASTQEIDDGLSLETLDDGTQRLWIHIADPTRWLMPGDDLDLEARRRCTTIYLPTGMIPMFPMELATGAMSLIQGQTCCALSFGITLTADGDIQDYQIHPTLIRPTYRLTYDDVDEMLELGITAEPELQGLAHWAKVRGQWRLTQGAISINMPESSIKVSETEDDIVIEVFNDSTARQMVAEMMILAGEVAARYGQTHALAIPFRSQPQPELPSDEELIQLPTGWVRDSAIRRCMTRSEVGITPSRHATLGLDSYSQVTSPIRRYLDLVTHFQLKAHLRGEPLPFSSTEVTELAIGASSAAYEATLVERQTKRYWALEYLRRHQDESWDVMLLRWLREDEGLGLIMVEDLGLELAMRFNRAVALGEQFQVRVSHASPRQDVIRFEEIAPESEEAAASAMTAS